MGDTTKHTRFLNEEGLEKLWEMIRTGFSPRWNSYKPNNKSTGDTATIYSSDDNNTCIESNTDNIVINFSSGGRLENGNVTYGNDIRLVLTGAKASENGIGGNAGLLSANDKEKINTISENIEDTITIKGEKVNGNALALADKYTNWNLEYNSITNTLNIVDKNNSNAVLTSVNVNDFIGEVFKDGFITDVSLVDKDENDNSGIFIKLDFSLTKTDSSAGNTEFTKTIYLNVSDLIDVYTAGTGISIDTTENSGIDNTHSNTKINIKSAATDEIGGIKVKSTNTSPTHHELTDAASRYFSVEKDTNDFAFVNVPICELEIINSVDPDNPSTINVSAGGKIKFISQVENNSTSTKHTVGVSYDEITINKETSITAVAGTSSTSTDAAKHNGTFTAITGITPSGTNGHELKLNTTTFKFPKMTIETNQILDGTGANVPDTTVTAYQNECRVLTDINYDETNDKIIKTYTDINVAIQSIPNSTINGLTYPIS